MENNSSGKLKSSSKVRLSAQEIERVFQSEEKIFHNLLILLSSYQDFQKRLQESKLFENLPATICEEPMSKYSHENLEAILLFKNELPSPIALANLSIDQFLELIDWDCVIQVEKSQEYKAL